MPHTIDRRPGIAGELALRRSGPHYEIIANGTFLMDTRNGESERLLVNAAAARMPGGGQVLLGGLGVGFSLRAALDHPSVGSVTVVERESAILEWNRGVLSPVHGNALADPRVHCVHADFLAWLGENPVPFDAICLDLDNGPDWTVTPDNATLYTAPGLASLAAHLTPNGILAIWSASASPPFEHRLRTYFPQVEAIPVPVPRGEPDVIYLAR